MNGLPSIAQTLEYAGIRAIGSRALGRILGESKRSAVRTVKWVAGDSPPWTRLGRRGKRIRSCGHRILPDELTGSPQVSMILHGRVELTVIGNGPAQVAFGFIDPSQVRLSAPAQHIVARLVRAGFGEKLEQPQKHALGLAKPVPLELGQGQVVCRIDVEAILNLSGDRLLLVDDLREVLGQPERDIILDGARDIAAQVLDPSGEQREFVTEEPKRLQGGLHKLTIPEEFSLDIEGNTPEFD